MALLRKQAGSTGKCAHEAFGSMPGQRKSKAATAEFPSLREDLWEDHRSSCQEWRLGVCDGLAEPTLTGLQSRLSTENVHESCESSSGGAT